MSSGPTSPTVRSKPSSLVTSMAVGGLLTALATLFCIPLVWLFERLIPTLATAPVDSMGQALHSEPWRFLLYSARGALSSCLPVLPVTLLSCALLLGIVSIALWQRRHWARPSFVALLWLSALGNFALLIALKDHLRFYYLLLGFSSTLYSIAADLSVKNFLLAQSQNIFLLLLATALTTALATLALHAWLAWRLGQADIRAEFAGPARQPAID